MRIRASPTPNEAAAAAPPRNARIARPTLLSSRLRVASRLSPTAIHTTGK